MRESITPEPPFVLETTPGCINTPRILFALEEASTSCSLCFREPGFFDATYGLPGPLLRDGAFELIESTAILRHVARKYGAGVILPESLEDLALVDRWIDFFSGRVVWHIMRLSLLSSLDPEHRPEGTVSTEQQAFHALLSVADRWLSEHDWLAGAFSVADCCAVTMLRVRQRYELTRHGHLNRYLDRLESRPAFARARARLSSG